MAQTQGQVPAQRQGPGPRIPGQNTGGHQRRRIAATRALPQEVGGEVHIRRSWGPALKYLSRYLYRGVIGEKQIVDDRDGQVTFRYLESGSGQTCYRTLPGADFLWLVIQHVLPKGFRRVRDVGILHGKARHWLLLVQRILAVIIAPLPPRERPCIACPQCQSPMQAIGFIRPHGQSG
jgi:hypothetical protein